MAIKRKLENSTQPKQLKLKGPDLDANESSSTAGLVCALVQDDNNVAKAMLEVYYYTQELGMVEFMRSLFQMSVADRLTLVRLAARLKPGPT